MGKDNMNCETPGRSESKDSNSADITVGVATRTSVYSTGPQGAPQVGAPFAANPLGIKK